jgi:cytidine deaminase
VTDIDWTALRNAADEAGRNAYAPYSNLRVGAAGLTGSGEVVVGCNVENASYGLTLCAECGVVAALVASGDDVLVAVTCTAVDQDELLMPCGRCRQVLYEFGGEDLLVDGPYGPLALGDLLPHAFGPEHLPEGPPEDG